jgi:hypothetical protein
MNLIRHLDCWILINPETNETHMSHNQHSNEEEQDQMVHASICAPQLQRLRAHIRNVESEL